VIDGDPPGCIFLMDWPRASLKQWLLALGAIFVLMTALYFLFKALGW